MQGVDNSTHCHRAPQFVISRAIDLAPAPDVETGEISNETSVVFAFRAMAWVSIEPRRTRRPRRKNNNSSERLTATIPTLDRLMESAVADALASRTAAVFSSLQEQGPGNLVVGLSGEIPGGSAI